MKRTRYYWSLIVSISKASFMSQIIYRTNGMMAFANMAVRILVFIFIYQIAFTNTSSISGWTKEEMFLFYGVFLLVDSIFDTFFSGSLQKVPEYIENGTLDQIISKPTNPIFLITFREFYYFKIVNIILSLGIIGLAWTNLKIDFSTINFLSFLILVSLGTMIYYSINLILATVSFHTVHTPFSELLESVGGIMRFPFNIFNSGIQFAFTFILPLIFVVTIPVEALLGIYSNITFLAPIIAIILLFLATKFWNFSLKKYTSASS